MQRWIVLYDGDCGLCKWLLAGLLRWDRRGRLEPVALQRQEAATLLDDLSVSERFASWHLVTPSGTRYSGGAALPPILRALPCGNGPGALFALAPAFTDRCYRWVADHRVELSRWIPSRWKRRAAVLVTERERLAEARSCPAPER